MARKKKGEGETVRIAFDGPDLDHDKTIGEMEARNREDGKRASSAGESRAAIKAFLDDSNMNPKAFSWLRMILKQNDKDQAKAMDIIRSLEVGLVMVKAHVSGQQGDLFTEPMGSEADDFEPLDPVSDVVPDDLRKPSYSTDADFADEQDAFDKQLAAVAG
jgi:hypothetical protein